MLAPTAIVCTIGAISAAGAQAAPADVAYALRGSSLLTFDPASPGSLLDSNAIGGVVAGETLVGIDVRPQNGMLYALGVDAASDTGSLYLVGPTGTASVVGIAGSIDLTEADGATQVDLPDPATVGYGFDFNPVADRIRVVAGDLNFRVDPNTGNPVDTNNGAAGYQTDGSISGGTTTVDAAAYTNSRANATATTLYTLDAATDSVYVQSPPNNGTQTAVGTLTVGGNTLDFTSIGGFDIDPDSANIAYAALRVAGANRLYRVNLTTAAATLVGTIGGGASVQGLALQRDFDSDGFPVVALDETGTDLTRFASASPNAAATTAISLSQVNVVAGESLVGVAWRPQTGQLMGLGVDAPSDTASLYVIDPQTGSVTPVGPPTAWNVATDLPDPATTAYGLDFNPSADLLRIVTSDGDNLRLDPDTGAAIAAADTDLNGAGASGVGAVSYTNAYRQAGGPPTTLYDLNPLTDRLYVQSPPNSGTLTHALTLRIGGAVANLTTPFAGFDIPSDVEVSSNNAFAAGDAIVAAEVGGTSGAYNLELATGRMTLLGFIAGGPSVRSIAVGDAQRDLAELTATPGALAFGSRDITLPASAIKTITIENPGTTDVTLTDVRLSGSQASQFVRYTGSASDCAFGDVLTPGDSCVVRVAFDPTSNGAKSASALVDSNAGIVSVSLSGTGTTAAPAPALSGTPNPLAFGARGVEEVATDVLTSTIRNTGTLSTTLTNVTLDGTNPGDFHLLGGGATDCGSGTVLAVDATCTVRATFDPVTTGAKSATISLTGNGASTAVLLTGTGTFTELTSDSGELAFDPRDVADGASTAVTARLTNTGTETITLGTLALSGDAAGDYARIAGLPTDCGMGTQLVAGASCDLRVTFDPSLVGGRKATLTVNSDIVEPLDIALTGSGTQRPAPSPNPTPTPTPTPSPSPSPAPAVPAAPVTPSAPAKPATPVSAPAATKFTVAGEAALTPARSGLDTGVTLQCPANRTLPCGATVRLTARIGRGGKPVTIGYTRKAYSVKAGREQRLRASLTARGRRAVNDVDGLRVTVTVAFSATTGKRTTRVFGVTVG